MGWSLYLNGEWLDEQYQKVIPDWMTFKELVW